MGLKVKTFFSFLDPRRHVHNICDNRTGQLHWYDITIAYTFIMCAVHAFVIPPRRASFFFYKLVQFYVLFFVCELADKRWWRRGGTQIIVVNPVSTVSIIRSLLSPGPFPSNKPKHCISVEPIGCQFHWNGTDVEMTKIVFLSDFL
jgi:hypothetical protein